MNDMSSAGTKIAIVGRAGRFPAARSVDQFWSMLKAERAATTWLSDEDLLSAGVPRADLSSPNYVKAAQILPDMECFDATFWGFSPREASILDPQHRHFLETAWEALEDAGHMPENFKGRIGVFAGSGMQAYLPYNILSNPNLVRDIGMFLLRHTGNDKDFLPTRLSYLLNLQGPSVAVQTACSTSLVAVHLAAQSLLNLECDMAIAGGVTIELPHRRGYHYAEGEILSPDGICRAFDNDSQGTVFGSGSALVVMRRLEDALADGDDIKAVILASAINNDGARKAGYLAPSVDGQAEAAGEALALANVEASSITYIEAHGTGTPVGDPIELAALTQVYGEGGRQFCGIGSAKTNIGHLDTAAGTAGLIKVVEALRHGTLPASLNYRTPNARFDIASSPFYVVDKTREWPRGSKPRRAAVNSLGVGGTNAHVILEEAPARAPSAAGDGWRLFPLSARTPKSLDGAREKWADFLEGAALPPLSDMAFTLREGRRTFAERTAIAARDLDGLKAAMAGKAPLLARSGRAGDATPEVVFLFPGGGAQYPGAGRDLLEESDVFRAAVAECFEVLPEAAPEDLFDMMFERPQADREAREKLNRSAYAIPALFILEYAYARLWESWGIRPAAILAHSVGEYAGAVVAGALDVVDAMRIVTLRGKVMDAAPKGAMTVVPASEAVVRELVGDGLDIAAVNAPQVSVVSGTIDAIEALEARLKGTEHEAKRVHIDVAAHSRVLDGQLGTFRDGFAGVRFSPPKVPFVSSLRGDWGREGDFSSADYWVQHLRNTVHFTDAVCKVLDRPDRIILEVGPGQTLGPLVGMATGTHRARAIIPSGRKPSEAANDMGVALAAIGGLWAHGVEIDWSRLPGGIEGRRVSLPTYAFEKQRHWIEPGKGAANDDAAQPEPARIDRIAQMDGWFEGFDWIDAPLAQAELARGSEVLLLAGDGPVTDAVLVQLDRRGCKVTRARPGAAFAGGGRDWTLRVGAPEDLERLIAGIGSGPRQIISLLALDAANGPAFDAGFALMRALQVADAGDGVQVVLAATGAVPAGGNADMDAAALIGPVRVAPREMPGLKAALVDVGAAGDGSVEPASIAAALLAELAAGLPTDRVLLRDGRRRIERRAKAAPVAGDGGLPARLRQGGVYLVTGGLTGVGRALALWLAETAAAKLVLVSRSARSDDPLAARIATLGGEALILRADIADPAQAASAVAAAKARFGAINGVIHGAGVIDDAPLSLKTLDAAHAVLAPKIEGARNLAALLPDGTLDVFAVFSSSSVVIAPAGQSDYVGANAALEVLASSRGDGLSIAWGVWKDIGMAQRAYGVATEAGPHPLLGPRRDTAEGEIRFEGALDPEIWVIREHVVGGQPVLPGTAYLEMAQAALAEAAQGSGWELESLTFESPMIFAEGLPVPVTVILSPRRDGYDFSVESRPSGTATPVVHARAKAVRNTRSSGASIPKSLGATAPAMVRSARSGHAPQEDLIDFGPRWKCIGDIRTSDSQAEGVFTLGAAFRDDLQTFRLHPAVMDMAMTVGLNLLSDGGAQGKVYAPMSMGRVRVLGPLPQSVVARAVCTAEQAGRYASFDVVISAPQGKPLVVIEALAMRGIEGGALGGGTTRLRLTDRLLATGIRAAEAPELFARVLSHPARRIVVSPVSLDMVRLAMAEAAAPKAAQSGAVRPVDGRAASNPVEEKLGAIWGELLGVDAVGPDDDFFALGGHSLNAVRMFGRVRKEFGVDLPLATLFEAPTLGKVAAIVADLAGIDISAAPGEAAKPAVVREWSPLVEIKKGSDHVMPLYCVHGAGGNVLNFRSLSGYLHDSIPFFGLRALGSDGGRAVDETIEAMADRYVAAILSHQPEGPYRLAGYSGGGVIAWQMALRLRAEGRAVEGVYFFDSLAPAASVKKLSVIGKVWAARHWDLKFLLGWRQRRLSAKKSRAHFAEIKAMLEAGQELPDELTGIRLTANYTRAQAMYQPAPYDGRVVIFRAKQAGVQFAQAGEYLGWKDLAKGPVEVFSFDCDHFTMMADPAISKIAAVLNTRLQGGD
jgi:acyl transferase domain-containing protein/thioesterase domain-containing protein/acyl carrier protein